MYSVLVIPKLHFYSFEDFQRELFFNSFLPLLSCTQFFLPLRSNSFSRCNRQWCVFQNQVPFPISRGSLTKKIQQRNSFITQVGTGLKILLTLWRFRRKQQNYVHKYTEVYWQFNINRLFWSYMKAASRNSVHPLIMLKLTSSQKNHLLKELKVDLCWKS